MELQNKSQPKKNKYKNQKVLLDGIKFDSKFESERYASLKLLEIAGAIKDLQLQVKFELQPSFKSNNKTIRAINYVADFVYINDRGKIVAEDTKGFATKEYLLKKKMFLYKFPNIIFLEVRK